MGYIPNHTGIVTGLECHRVGIRNIHGLDEGGVGLRVGLRVGLGVGLWWDLGVIGMGLGWDWDGVRVG
jgi:hypothetical protein